MLAERRFAEQVVRRRTGTDPEPLVKFPDAVRTRQRAGGNADVSHRVATIYHLANVAFRAGRTLKFYPETDRVVGDDEANRIVNQPMRAPWRLA